MTKSEPSGPPSPPHRPSRPHGGARWAWHYRTLVALRDHLVQQSRSPQATDDFDREFVRTLLAHEPDALAEINAALARIADSRYGRCEHTGQPIDAARLRARPWTRYASDRA
jgi:RNA polymerase-binding transcription factor DksA